MGYIYRITNRLNNKVYIGQTQRTVLIRWKEHIYYSSLIKNKFYNAINKYGIANFDFDTIEEVPDSSLDEREKYWISFYDSFRNGYNSTEGGDHGKHSNISIEEILPMWLETYNLSLISRTYHHTNETIIKLLQEYNVYLDQSQLNNVAMLDDNHNLIMRFANKSEAARYLISLNKTTSTTTTPIVSAITRAINKQIKAYGYRWELIGPQQQKRSYNTGVILQIDDDNNIVNVFPSVTTAANAFNVAHSHISTGLNMNCKRLGYYWKTEEAYNV